MKRKLIWIAIVIAIILVIFIIGAVGNSCLTNLIEETNVVCKDQKFSSVDEAMQAYEEYERGLGDTSLDYCPPYEVVHSFEYEDNTIVIYSYCESFDGEEGKSYAVRILKHNDDNTFSFDSGFAELSLEEPDGDENYYYFTNINTSKGKKSISFLYMDKDSDKDIYVDGKKAVKAAVTIDGKEFYLCYALSSPDTFIKNLTTSVSSRHKVEIK